MAERRTYFDNYSSTKEYPINAILQNYAYNKNVFVRYTTDNWATYTDKALSYDSTNADGTENWNTTVTVEEGRYYNSDIYTAAEGFEYAICYQVNGQTYWANNLGSNYDGTYYLHG